MPGALFGRWRRALPADLLVPVLARGGGAGGWSVLVECCVRLCPALGSRTGSTLSAADPCAHLGTATGERCQTGHLEERGAGTGQAPTPEAMGQLWTEAELLPLPGTPAGTVELSSPQESPRGPGLGREGTGPTVRGGTTTEPLGPLVSAGTPEQAAAGREQPSPASLGVTSAGSPATVQAGTDPATMHPLGTDPSAPASVSAVTLLSTPLPSPGTGWGVLRFSPTVDTPLGDPSPGMPHSSSRPASSLGPTTAIGVTATGVTATLATAASPEWLRDVGTVTPEPGAAVPQRDVVGLTWGSPTHVPTVMPRPPQQPTDSHGTLGHGGGPGSPPAAVDTDLAHPSSSPGGRTDTDTPQVTPAGVGRVPQVFIVEDQPPLLRASLLRIPCELVLDMAFVPALQDPGSHECQELLHSFNETVTPLFASVPGFLRLEVTGIREGSVVLRYDALFAAEQLPVPGLDELLEAALGSAGAQPGLAVGTAPVLRHAALARPLDPCAVLFACPSGFACVSRADGNVTCTSLCHRDYCKNHGICTHARDQQPRCQCPVGSDFWFMGLRCDYRVTQQSLLGMAAGVLLSIVLLGAVLAAIAVRRFKALLLEARADQTRSSYRRFCRLDDVSAQYWSRSGLPSASSLDNPAFSNSEELLHLQILDNGCCGCQEDSAVIDGAKRGLAPCAHPQCRSSFRYDWDTSSSSMNDPMVDSGKASDISVSSWPMEPLQWAPFPLLHQLSRQRPHKARRPQSFCEGLELGTLERSWTA
ncbi:chondroitin sulfate proteoglycan 5-like [Aphelocoma coerulescens]|uniref:chondroitin sulfate proteoglycan 5-like n=1 Tax=Aphelocoma coerulescens TaxID=39617 RepID=UPI00360527F2